MGRRGLLDSRGQRSIRAIRRPPRCRMHRIATAVHVLGDAILVPISEVGSVASAAGWMAACAAYFRMGPAPRERIVAAVGVTVGFLMIVMKVVPGIPGHFSGYEWLALAVWSALGLGLGWRQRMVRAAVTAK